MKKFTISLLFASLLIAPKKAVAQTDINNARSFSIGSTVTITGVITNGAELGTIRYLEDGTAGIAAYGSTLASSVTRGDNVTITGTLKDYNGLLEIDPVSSFTINSSGNTLPTPQVFTPSQLGETTESELIQINGVVFAAGGSSFAGNTSYNFSASTESGVVYVRTGSPLVGQIIPTSAVTLIGISSQFNAQYQVLPRDMGDLVSGSSINITQQLTTSNITTTSFDVDWTTDISGSTFVKHGYTPNLELGYLNGSSGSTNHKVTIGGANPADIFYVKAFSVAGSDTAISGIRVFATQSNSTGKITAYFNKSVDTTLSKGVSAKMLYYLIDDTLISYINRAEKTLDIAIYSFDNANISNISTAINNAYSRGVKVRVIYENSNANAGIADLNSSVKKLISPSGSSYGIMHNKFVVVDAKSSNPNLPIVWTGGTNWTDNQINTDANNVIIFQDQTLAKAYTLEFEEMWGDTGVSPNSSASKFGPFKTDNTPHEFVIGGKRVEQYFSPSDGVNARIIEKINSANSDIEFETMLITRSDIAYAITNKSSAGVDVYGLVDAQSSTTVWSILFGGIPTNQFVEYTSSGIMHHKYMIIDQSNALSDPLVLNGSHNWSNSADSKNDENTVIVHDSTLANIYYQEFVPRFTSSGGLLPLSVSENSIKNDVKIYPNPNNGFFNIWVNNSKNKEIFIRIVDIAGKEIFSTIDFLNQHAISIPNLEKGIYLLKINVNDEWMISKIIIQ